MKKITKYRLLSGILLAAVFVSTADSRADLQADEEGTIGVFERVSPSVAFIKNAALQWDWFSNYAYEVPQGAGSGFVWDKEGHIVTNVHVIYQADKVDVVLADHKSFAAKVVGFSADHDLAVLKIDAPAEILTPILLGKSEDLKVGQKAISIGNPFGLDYSLSVGVVSALGRSIRSLTGRKIHDVIQTDAAINPGNSGGPLLDSSGKLIGVATAIASPSGANAGVGFAIPVDTVKRVIPQLIQHGKVKRAGLGIVVVPENIRRRLGIRGAMILQVQNNSAAERAGLKPTRRNFFGEIINGDIIVALDNQPVAGNEDLIRFFDDKKKAGDKVDVEFIRDGKKYGTTAMLQELP